MDPETLLILLGLGGLAYLYFAGSPASASSPAAPSPTPTLTPLTSASTPVLTPGTTMPAATAQSSGGGTTVSPSTAGLPSDQTFLNAVAPIDPAGAKDWQTSTWESQYGTLQMMAQMRLSASSTDNCSGFSSSNVTFQEVAGLSSTAATTGISIAASAGAVAASAVPFVGIGVAIVGLVTQIFSAHKKKVQEQAQLDCAMVAAVNNALDEIDSALASGTLTPTQAQQGWETIYTQAQQTVAPMIKDSSSSCNGPCILIHVLRAILNKYEYEYGV